MPRFFLSHPIDIEDGTPKKVCLEGENAFHLSVSLRSHIGDEVILCDSQAVEWNCRIEEISGGKKNPRVILQPFEGKNCENESPLRITLFQGMPKGKKTDSIIQKCTELGASKVVFVYTDRSVPLWDGDDKKKERFRKIAEEAAKQCGRGKMVEVDLLPDLDSAVLQMLESDVSFACYEGEVQLTLKKLLAPKNCSSLSFFIGPEGGISDREALLLKDHNIPTVTLGRRILRTETAPLAVLSMILYEKEF